MEPVSKAVAQEACGQITGKYTPADCIFDVMVTGNTGFAQTYLAQQQLQPGATETTMNSDKDVTKSGRTVSFTATVVPAVARGGAAPTGTVQFTLRDLHDRIVDMLTLELTNGHATWGPLDQPAGLYQVTASYIQSKDSSYLPSVSPKVSLVVLETFDLFMWLAILLVISVSILVVWWYRRTS